MGAEKFLIMRALVAVEYFQKPAFARAHKVRTQCFGHPADQCQILTIKPHKAQSNWNNKGFFGVVPVLQDSFAQRLNCKFWHWHHSGCLPLPVVCPIACTNGETV